MIKSIAILAALTYTATVAGTLRNIFLIQRAKTLTHLVTAVESIVFAGTLVMVTKLPLQYYIPVYMLARQLGVWTSLFIDGCLALGTVEVTLYRPRQEGIELADRLRSAGYHVLTHKSYGLQGQENLTLVIRLPKRQLDALYTLVNDSCSEWTIKNVTVQTV